MGSRPLRSRALRGRSGRRRSAKRRQRGVDLGDRRADVGVGLEDRGEELCLDPAGQRLPFDAVDDAVDGGDLLERRGVEDHQLLLDAERERRGLAERAGINVP